MVPGDIPIQQLKLSAAKQVLLEKRLQGKLPSAAPFPSISRCSSAASAALSFAQQRLWFLQQLNPQSPAYNISVALRITGPLEVNLLAQSFNEVVRRHESLRATFVSIAGQPQQVIAPHLTLTLPVLDLHPLPIEERETEVIRLAQTYSQLPFDLAQSPLLKITLLRLSEQEHVLLLNMHHIISDQWSMDVLLREVGLLYAAFRQGKASPLAELSIQYTDFACWQRERMQGEVLTSQLNYWQQQLADSPALLNLPTDHPRPLIQGYQGAAQSLVLPLSLTAKLKTLSQQEKVTLFMALLATFQTLLYRYTGQEDILVGSPVANRTQVEVEGLIGLLVNTLVLRAKFSNALSFRELLRQARETALDAYTHQELPFEMLVEKLQPERSLSYQPLFQVMFVFRPMPAETIQLENLTITSLEIDSGATKFDLTLFIEDAAQGLKSRLEYNTDLFKADTMARMLGHYQTLLEAIVANPDDCVAELPLLTAPERRQLLVEWNDTRADYPLLCLHQLFEAQVERTPNALAVVPLPLSPSAKPLNGRREAGAEALSYQELNRRANQLAHYLRRLGVGPETLVGLCMERSPEMMVGLLGILKAGGAYIPLDPADPPERLAFILSDAQAPVLLTQARLADSLNAGDSSNFALVCLDTDWPTIAQQSDPNPVSGVTLDNLVYVIYTSGSTGKPKGVMIAHRGVVNYLTWSLRAYPVTAGEGAPVHSSLSFDLTVTSLFAPLLTGRAVYLLPQNLGVDGLAAALPGQVPFSLVKLTPAHLELLNQQVAPQAAAGYARALIIGGENLLAETVAFWQDNAPDTLLVNEYGPTETVVGCCVYRVPSNQPRSGSIPIGRPIANTQLYILDRRLQPVPIGVPGELYIGGDGVARGYLNRPDLTREKFIPNPWVKLKNENNPHPHTSVIPQPSAFCLYKTGDLARYRPDGVIEFLGRVDDQVKLRGYRIELGEIEAVLREHPAVQEAVVIMREDGLGDKRLVAYLVPDPTQSPTSSALLDHFLRQKLPEYMLPAATVMLKALPLTANGKVDRRALPPPHLTGSLNRPFIPPQDSLERRLLEIWEEILNVRPIGVTDNFFALGGHSLLAVRLFARLAEGFGQNLPVTTLFQAPTVKTLAEVLRRQGWAVPYNSLVPIQPRGTRPPFFCVHGMGGGVLDYADLARALGPEQPFYGLQERGFDGVHEPFTRIEDMAAHYIAEIQTIQPEGPYFLGGYCYGGTVAFEMARQLQAQGQAVALLAIIDNTPPNSGYHETFWKPAVMVKFLQNIPAWLHDFSQLSLAEMTARLARKARLTRQMLLRRGQPGHHKPSRADIEAIIDQDFAQIPTERHKFLEAHYLAWLNYTPRPYAGRITLLRTQRYSLLGPYDPNMGWKSLAAGVEVKAIAGFHGNILQSPYVQYLAAQLKACLEQTGNEF